MFKDFTERIAGLFTNISSRYGPALISLVILAGAFFFYFNVVVRYNEQNLIERKFRGLHRMSANITSKLTEYKERKVPNFLATPGVKDKDFAILDYMSAKYGLNLYHPGDNIKEKSFISYDASGDGKFVFQEITQRNVLSESTQVKYVAADIKRFLDPLLRRDIFSYYLLSFGDRIAFDNLNVTYRSLKAFLPADKARDSVVKGSVIQSGEIRQVEIIGRKYKLFLLPFHISDTLSLQLGGYMLMDEYESERKYLPTYALLWMVIGILGVLLMFPLLKIFLIRRSEQLLARNIAASLASLHLTGSVFILIALNLFVYFQIVMGSMDDKLRSIATGMNSMVLSEVDSALQELSHAQNAVLEDSGIYSLIHAAGKNTKGDPAELLKDSFALKNYKAGQSYPLFEHIVWTDQYGTQLARWTTHRYLPLKINIKDRSYFNAVKEQKLWRHPRMPYVLESISSWVSDSTAAIIATSFAKRVRTDSGVKNLALASISAPLRTFYQTVVPFGYGFCMVDQNGEVLFHQDPKRNLNENLLQECTNNTSFRSLLQNRTSGFFGCRYSGSDYRFCVLPLTGTPYYMVAFRDLKTIWSEDLDVISTSSILALINLFVILIAVLVIQVNGYRKSLLQNPFALFIWLRPDRELARSYRVISLHYWFSMVLQTAFLLFIPVNDAITLVGMAFSFSFLLLCMTYYQYTIEGRKQKYLQKQKGGDKKVLGNFEKRLRVERRVRFSEQIQPLIFLLILYSAATLLFLSRLSTEDCFFYLGSQVAFFFCYWASRKLFVWLSSWGGYQWWYVQSIFSFIVATGIMPLIVFYVLSYRQERVLSLKHSQFELANSLLERDIVNSLEPDKRKFVAPAVDFLKDDAGRMVLAAIETERQIPKGFSAFLVRNGLLLEESFFWLLPSEKKVPPFMVPVLGNDSMERIRTVWKKPSRPMGNVDHFEDLYKRIKPAFTPYSRQLEWIRNRRLDMAPFYWSKNKRKDSIYFYQSFMHHSDALKDKWGIMIASPIRYEEGRTSLAFQNDTLHSVGFIGCILLLLWLLYFMLQHMLKKVFFGGFHADSMESGVHVTLPAAEPPLRHFLVYGPDSQTTLPDLARLLHLKVDELREIQIYALSDDTVKEQIDEQTKESPLKFVDELLNAIKPELPSEDFPSLVIRGFDQYDHLPDMSKKKLNFVEALLQRGYRLILMSSHSLHRLVVGEENTTNNDEKEIAGRWSLVLRQFYNVYHKWHPQGWPDKRTATLRYEVLTYSQKVLTKHPYGLETQVPAAIEIRILFEKICQECQHGDFLWNLRKPLYEHLEQNKDKYFNLGHLLNDKGYQERFLGFLQSKWLGTKVNKFLRAWAKRLKQDRVYKPVHLHFSLVFEKICMILQPAASNYYCALWQSLSREEQQTLYDISLDEIVNPCNHDVAVRLATLGLVVQVPHIASYRIMNQSFRNYILSEVNKQEVKSFKKDAEAKGSWSQFQLPLLITLLGVSTFLFITQKDAFTSLISYMGAAVAGIAALLKLLGVIPNAKS